MLVTPAAPAAIPPPVSGLIGSDYVLKNLQSFHKSKYMYSCQIHTSMIARGTTRARTRTLSSWHWIGMIPTPSILPIEMNIIQVLVASPRKRKKTRTRFIISSNKIDFIL